MAEVKGPAVDLSSAEWARLELVVDRFERAWLGGAPPVIEDYLPAGGVERRALLVELVHADLECRLKTGKPAAVEDYLSRYPELAADNQTALNLIAVEYDLRQRRDPAITPAEYALRFPQYQKQLPVYLRAVRRSERYALLVSCPNCRASFPIDPGSPQLARCPSCGLVPPAKEVTSRLVETGHLNFPGYEVLGELGRGGMGIVYRARQLSRDRVVALKVVRPEQLVHSSVVRRFRREAQAAARLDHPNIVHVLDAGQAGDLVFLAMEFVEGTTLQDLVEKNGPLPVPQTCECVRQAALGLQHAYERGLVHRDIKPANLMLLSGAAVSGEGSQSSATHHPPLATHHLKILDMGLARLEMDSDVQRSSSHLTLDGALIGTPDYIAPEQAEDPRLVDIRADLYSLGCTFYFLLTGQVPFPGGTFIQKLDKHRWQAPTPVDRLRPALPRAVAAVVNRLLAKRPADRYQQPQEVAEALRPFVGDPPAPERAGAAGARPDGPAEPATLPYPEIPSPSPAPAPGPAEEVYCFQGHGDWVSCVALSPGGRVALSGSIDHTLCVWDLARGQELRRFTSHTGSVLAVAVFPAGGFAVSGGVDQKVRLWSVDTGREHIRFTGHGDFVWSVAFSPRGDHVLSGSGDRTLRRWGASGRELCRYEGHTGEVYAVAYSPDGRRIASGSADRTVRLWDAPSGQQLACWTGHRAAVFAVAFSLDGRWVLSGGADRALRLWDVGTGQVLACLEGHTQSIRSVAFCPDRRRLLSGSEDGTVRLWDLAVGREVYRFTGHTEHVRGVAVAADGRHGLSGSADKTVRLWRLPT
jgi:serine/threonine protein kinase